MDSQLVQRTRYQLQARIRTAKTCPPGLFPSACAHLIRWVEEHPLLCHLLEPLRAKITEFEVRLAEDLAKLDTPRVEEISGISGPWMTASREEAAALGWAALKQTTTVDLSEESTRQGLVIALIVAAYAPAEREDVSEIVEALRDVALQSVYDYLDERIDSRNVVLGLLLKYKTRSEWYRRDRLRQAAESGLEGRAGERALAFDLYEYLHDQGVDFAIESVTASGEPDLVADAGGHPLVADAKYVTHDEKLAETVASGFRQVLRYCADKNEPVGYLVIFLNCGTTLDLRADRDDGFPCFRLGGIAIYYVLVDIRKRAKTASKLPRPRAIEVTYDRLVSLIREAEPGAAAP